MLIVHLEPSQNTESGDYYYRTHSPGIAMAQQGGIYVVNLTSLHPNKFDIIPHADVLVLKNICDPDLLPLIEARTRNGKLTIYELADDLGALQPWNPVFFFYKNRENFDLVCRTAFSCDGLQVTTDQLKKVYGNLNLHCEVFPNQMSHIPPEKPRKTDNKLVIGWGGSHGHLEDMAAIAPPLIDWIMGRPDVSLHLMCSEPIWNLFETLRAHKKKWRHPGTIDDYYRFLTTIDIGMAPLNNTAFNRSRSDVKFIEYAISEVVPVMAQTESYRYSVDNNTTGFLYRNSEELIAILDKLVDNPFLSQKIAESARQYVLRERLQHQHTQDRIDFYQHLFNGKNGGGFQSSPTNGLFKKWSDFEGAKQTGTHLTLMPAEFENLLHNGLVAMQTEGNKEISHRLFQKAKSLAPDNYLPFLYDSMNASDPIVELKRAIELKPDSIKAWILLGDVLARRGRLQESLEALETAANHYPAYEIPYLRVAALIEKHGNKSGAAELYQKAESLKEPFLSCLNPASQDQSLKTGEIPHRQKEDFFMDIEDLLTAYSGRSPKGEIHLSAISEDLQLKNREMNRKEAVIRFMYELSKGV